MLNFFDPVDLITRVPVVLLALTIHEFAHAYAAYRLGDPTAYRQGRCSLNPLVHLDPLGTLCLMFGLIGWAKPVPINPANFGSPRRDDLIVSAAGVASNLAQAVVFALLLRLLLASPETFGQAFVPLTTLLSLGMLINMALAVFNMLPIFPLDGFHVAMHLLPFHAQPSLERTRRFGMLGILGLVMLPMATDGRIDPLWMIISPVFNFLLHYVVGVDL
ncbi:MAG TPA: site-2 protease family protein [Phycisphaerae bacterium]|nr:site-2 protease family protein [Phycisphaerae bacterium]